MNKFQKLTGGHPFKLDDLEWLQTAYEESLRALVAAWDDNTYGGGAVLWGCDITISSGTVTITPGAILMAGEIFQVPGDSFPEDTGIGQTLVYKVETDYSPIDPQTYADATLQSPHVIRRANLQYHLSPTVGPYLIALPKVTVHDKIATRLNINTIKDRLNALTEGWHIVGGAGNPAYQNGFVSFSTTNFRPLSFKRDWMGIVRLEGCFDLPPSAPSDFTIFQLPADYRPTAVLNETIFAKADSDYRFDNMGGLTGGSLIVENHTGKVIFGRYDYGNMKPTTYSFFKVNCRWDSI